MLTNKEKKKIIELHAEGYSNNKIHIETGHAPKTIKDVFKEEEERIKHKKGGNKNADKPQEQKKDADNPIDTTRKIIEGLENLVKTGQRTEGEVPDLTEIWDQVEREWSFDMRRMIKEEQYQKMRESYQITIENVE